MTACAISIVTQDATGTALPAVRFTFIQADAGLYGADGAVVVARTIEVVTDGAGLATIPLQPGRYQCRVFSDVGDSVRPLTVPDTSSALLSELLNTPDEFELLSWAQFQALVAATDAPPSLIDVGLAAVAEGAFFLVAQTDALAIYRKILSGAVPGYIEI